MEDTTFTIDKRRKTKEQNILPSNDKPQPPSKSKKAGWDLLDTEKALYGDRCPQGYEKLSLLGKGGAAIVWLANDQTGQPVALKQFPKPKSQKENILMPESAKTEIEVGRQLFMNGPKQNGYALDPNKFPGIKMIARLLDVIEEPKDFWLVYEVGSCPLTKLLFEVKGETYKSERIYGVYHQQFYIRLREDR